MSLLIHHATIPERTTRFADTAFEVGERGATTASNDRFVFIISKSSRDPSSRTIIPLSNAALQTELFLDVPSFILEVFTPDGEIATLRTAVTGKVKKTTAVETRFVGDRNHVPFSQNGECFAVGPAEEGFDCWDFDYSLE